MKRDEAATHIVQIIAPRDGASGAATGDWVSLGGHDSIQVVYSSGAGTANQDVSVRLRQAKTAAGGAAKDLAAGQWHAAQHATDVGDGLAAVGSPGRFTDDGETQCLARVEVTADQLDVNDGFKYVTVSVTDSGSTAGKHQSVVGVLGGSRHSVAVEHQATVLA